MTSPVSFTREAFRAALARPVSAGTASVAGSRTDLLGAIGLPPAAAKAETPDTLLHAGPLPEKSAFHEVARELRAWVDKVPQDGSLALLLPAPAQRKATLPHHRADFLDLLVRPLGVRFRQVRAGREGGLQYLLAESAKPPRPGRKPDALDRLCGDAGEPDFLWLESTTRCNMRCRTCEKFYVHHAGHDMPRDLFDKIVAETFSRIDRVNLTGLGEPLLCGYFDEMLDAIEAHGIGVDFITNGMPLTRERLERLMGMKTGLALSIDGITQETLAFVRPQSKLDKLREILGWVRELRAAGHGRDFVLGVNVVAIARNIAELPDLVRFAAHEGADYVSIIEMGCMGPNAAFFREQAMRYHRSLANRYYQEARRAATAAGIRIDCPAPYADVSNRIGRNGLSWKEEAKVRYHALCQTFPPLRAIKRMADRLRDWSRVESTAAVAGAPLRGICRVPFERLMVDAEGRVTPCCVMNRPVLGNLREQSFDTIWNGDGLRELRALSAIGFPPVQCHHCTSPVGVSRGSPDAAAVAD